MDIFKFVALSAVAALSDAEFEMLAYETNRAGFDRDQQIDAIAAAAITRSTVRLGTDEHAEVLHHARQAVSERLP